MTLRLPLSPVADDRVRPVVVGAVLLGAVALLVSVQTSYGAGLAAVAVLSLVFALCWPALGGSWTPGPTTVVLCVAGAGIIASAVRDDLRWGAAAVAFGIILSFLQQVMRPAGREGLVLSLLAAVGGLAILGCGALLAALGHSAGSEGIVVVALVAVLASIVGDLLLPVGRLRPLLGLVVLVVAVVAALVVRSHVEGVTTAAAFGIAAAAGSLAWSLRRIVSLQPALLGVRGQLASGVGSVLVVGPVAALFAAFAS